jgi:N-methylhydantoinase A
MRLDRDLARRALTRAGEHLGMEVEEVAMGVFRIINAQMADLIRKSTIERGHDPRDCVLVAYGGAGPTHAVFYGADIGCKAILVPRDSTAFSAEGMLTCDVTHTAEHSRRLYTPFGENILGEINERFAELEERVLQQFEGEGATRSEIVIERAIAMRYRRQVHAVDVEVEPGEFTAEAGERLLERFALRYAQVYGKGALLPGAGNEIELFRLVGTRRIQPVEFPVHELSDSDSSSAVKGERNAYFEDRGFQPTTVYDGYALRAGNTVQGPAIVERMGDSVVVPPGYEASVDSYLTLRLAPTRGADDPAQARALSSSVRRA